MIDDTRGQYGEDVLDEGDGGHSGRHSQSASGRAITEDDIGNLSGSDGGASVDHMTLIPTELWCYLSWSFRYSPSPRCTIPGFRRRRAVTYAQPSTHMLASARMVLSPDTLLAGQLTAGEAIPPNSSIRTARAAIGAALSAFCKQTGVEVYGIPSPWTVALAKRIKVASRLGVGAPQCRHPGGANQQ